MTLHPIVQGVVDVIQSAANQYTSSIKKNISSPKTDLQNLNPLPIENLRNVNINVTLTFRKHLSEAMSNPPKGAAVLLDKKNRPYLTFTCGSQISHKGSGPYTLDRKHLMDVITDLFEENFPNWGGVDHIDIHSYSSSSEGRLFSVKKTIHNCDCEETRLKKPKKSEEATSDSAVIKIQDPEEEKNTIPDGG